MLLGAFGLVYIHLVTEGQNQSFERSFYDVSISCVRTVHEELLTELTRLQLLTSRCWRCRSFFQQPRIQRGKRCLMQGGTEGLSSEGRRQGQGWEIFCIRHQPSFPKPVGDGTAVEEEESREEGGAGAEVPDVQDGADQGQAPQLPVVTGEKKSFL